MDKKKMQALIDEELARFKKQGGEIKHISPDAISDQYKQNTGKSWLDKHKESPTGNHIKLKKRHELKKSPLKS